MIFRAFDYDVPGGCRICGAGWEVTTNPITSRLVEKWTHDCRCPPKTEAAPINWDSRCACGNAMHFNSKMCVRCGNERDKAARREKEAADKAKRAARSRPKPQAKAVRVCLDCPATLVRYNAKRCPRCAMVAKRKRADQQRREKRAA